MRERPITSKKYELSANRYRELKHFVLQYPEWKSQVKDMRNTLRSPGTDGMPHGTDISDSTGNTAVLVGEVQSKIDVVEKAIEKACKTHTRKVILDAVTHGETYEKYSEYISRYEFYAERRRFFFALHCLKK